MEDIIKQKIREIEAMENIRVVYACESGSRAWGFASPDSDYDVRMIYARPQDWYLSIEDRKDTLAFPLHNELDISGWDIRKALQIFRKSNAVIFEWLQSPVVYQDTLDFAAHLRELMPEYFSPRTVMHHHLGLVHKAYSEIHGEKKVKLKKYFYVLRSLLSAMWVKEYTLVPPMAFTDLITLLAYDHQLRAVIQDLLALKAKADESTTVQAIAILNKFIEEASIDCQLFARAAKTTHQDTGPLNQLFRKIVAGR